MTSDQFNDRVSTSIGVGLHDDVITFPNGCVSFRSGGETPWILRKVMLINGEHIIGWEEFVSLNDLLDVLQDDEYPDGDFVIGDFLMLSFESETRTTEVFTREFDFESNKVREITTGYFVEEEE